MSYQPAIDMLREMANSGHEGIIAKLLEMAKWHWEVARLRMLPDAERKAHERDAIGLEACADMLGEVIQ